eukprot:GHUV01048265.1.p1 GENE.GHUV01048265.1~~GHUV01048265.1.p1  ORF type:complete len:178 (+),score=67.61 GHUV01048265.1:547-1080(+)
MDEYTFWMIYFTLCKRYLPSQEEQLQQPQSAATSAAVAANGISSAQKAAVSGLPLSSSAKNLRRSTEDGIEERVRQPQVQPDDSSAAQHTSSQSAIDAGGAGATSAPDTGTETDDGLADLADDPDLDAYLQNALQLDGSAGASGAAGDHEAHDDAEGSDIDDLDDYISKLDAEVASD